MPITLLDATSGNPTDASSVPVPLGSNWQDGDVRIIRAERSRGNGGLSISSGWTQLYASEAQSAGGPYSRWVGIWFRVLQTDDAAPTLTPSTSIANIAWSAITIRGWDPAQTLAPSTTGSTSASSSVVAPSVATGAGMLLCWFDVTRTDNTANTGSWGVPAGMTPRTSQLSGNTNGYNILLASEARTSGASGTRTATPGSAGSWSATSLFIAEGSTAAAKSGGDSATGGESGGTSSARSGGDSATGVEAGQVSVPRSGSDSAVGSESGSAGNGGSGADSALGAESGSSTAAVAGTDTATASDSGAIRLAPAGPTDTGAGAEGGATAATVTGADTAVGTNPPGSSTAAITGGDTAAGANLPGATAAVVTGADTAGTAESGTVTIPGSDSGAGTDALTTLYGRPLGADTALGADGGYVETLFGEIVISIFAIVDGAAVPLPDYTDLTLAPTRNGPGAITLAYPAAGLNASILLANTVGDDRDVEVEIWTIGSPDGALRGYLQEVGGDGVKEGRAGMWVFTGGFLELRMAEARVWPQPLVGEVTLGDTVTVKKSTVTAAQWTRLTATLGYTASSDADPTVSVPQKVLDAVKANAPSVPVLADPKREAKFVAATPGAIMSFLLAQARARGALTDITTSFTAEKDSGGTPWPSLVTTTVSPGATYEQVLNLLAQMGRAEWSMSWTGTARQLNLWIAGARGTDKSIGPRPIVLRAGRNLAESPVKWSVRSAPTAMGAAGADGWYADTSDGNALARRGRRIEGWTSSQNLATADAVQAYAQRRLSSESDGTLEVTHGLSLLPGEPRPLIAFDVGDWLYSSTGTSLDRYRVVEWSLTINAERSMSATVTLNDAFVDAVTRQRKQLDALSSGETVVGTSSQPADVTPPSPPTGLLVSSGAFNEGIDAYAVVLAAWTAPVTNVSGSALTNLAGYRVEWTEYADPTNWRAAATVDATRTQAQFTTATGLPILVRVAAYKPSGAQSAWTTLTTPHTTEVDATPPPQTSAITGSVYLGVVTWTWDGKSADGADMFAAAADFDHAELHMSTSSNFTPTTTTLIDKLYGKGSYSYAKMPDGSSIGYGVTVYARLVPVDIRGNRQPAASVQGTATPTRLLGDDFGAGVVGSAALADASVIRAKIGAAAVGDLQVENVGVGKLTAGLLTASMVVSTGSISTRTNGNTGSGVTTDSVGLRLYDQAGNVTVQLRGTDGSFMAAGEFRTSLTSGARIVMNPGGSSPAETRWYPSSTNQYARIMPSTSVAIGYEGQAGINMKAHSARLDQQSGEVNVYPGLASLVWGNENANGKITSRIAASDLLAFVGGPRVRLSAAIGQYYGIQLSLTNNDGAVVGQSSLVVNDEGPYGLVRLISDSPNGNSGIQFNDAQGGYHGISVIDGTSGSLVDVYARAFKTSSARRLKREIVRNPIDLTAIKNIGLYKYTFTGGRGPQQQVGLMADELPADVVTTDHNGDEVVDVYGLVALAVGAIADLMHRIDTLERKAR